MVERLKPIRSHGLPVDHTLARDMHVVTSGDAFFLTVEREVIGIFVDQQFSDESGRGQAAFL